MQFYQYHTKTVKNVRVPSDYWKIFFLLLLQAGQIVK